MMAHFQFVCFERTQEMRCSFEARYLGGPVGKGADGSKVARFSIFCTGGVGAFGIIGFTGTMDNTLPHLALPGVLQREQAADCS